MNKKSVIAFVYIFLCMGCSAVPPRPIPDSVRIYSAPISDPSDNASIENYFSGTRLLGSLQRSRVEGVDWAMVPPITGEQQPPVKVSAGKHLIIAICEDQIGSVRPRAVLDVDLKAGHRYVLKCEHESSLLNVGTDIYIEDATDNSVILKERTWAPNRGGIQRNF